MLRATNRLAERVVKGMSTQRPRRYRHTVSTFLGASVVVGCVFAAQTIYLDSSSSSDISGNPFESLRRRKSTDSFDPTRQPVDTHAALRQHEETRSADGKATGIARYDIVQVSSNDPNEDDHSAAIVPHPKGSWAFFAVLDGHSGWETSAWLRENLIPAVTGALADLYHDYHSLGDSFLAKAWALIGHNSDGGDAYTPPASSIDIAMRKTFKRLDDDIVHDAVERVFAAPSKNLATNILAPAYAGSCALLSFFDSHTKTLRVAVTGDSRAVLGRRKVDPNTGEVHYETHVLSVDQDGNNPLEIARLNDSPEHPGEAVIQNGRVLGMGPSRAFGDARWKWDLATQTRLKKDYLGRSTPGNVKTPPYLTAEPEITTTKTEPGDFLIMATDGLWECLQSEEAVGLVGAWLNTQGGGESVGEVISREALPVELPEKDDTVRYRQWGARKAFVNIDSNAATHLARNALGGNDSDLAAALLAMRNPRGRTYRDDITAIVIFFD
ncbi:hypothetical protein HWV62_18598 [Athelia sp. TMB]|nr:hypothetical protein HWV62_18598 [Athelia sp. TMB]